MTICCVVNSDFNDICGVTLPAFARAFLRAIGSINGIELLNTGSFLHHFSISKPVHVAFGIYI